METNLSALPPNTTSKITVDLTKSRSHNTQTKEHDESLLTRAYAELIIYSFLNLNEPHYEFQIAVIFPILLLTYPNLPSKV